MYYDQSFNKSTIAESIKASDFANGVGQLFEIDREELIQNAIRFSKAGFSDSSSITKNSLKGKPCYALSNFAEELVLRKATNNLKTIYKSKPANRSEIVSNLRCFLTENVDFRLYRLDIRNFYESIEVNDFISEITHNVSVSRLTTKIVASFFEEYKRLGGIGIPRGLSLSAVISEALMEKFDQKIRRMDSVFYYNRFVDDIVIITDLKTAENTFLESLEKILPKNLKFHNGSKKYIKTFSCENDIGPDAISEFDYLGYNYKLYGPIRKNRKSEPRKVNLDISEDKIKKIKSRCVKSIIDFIKNEDYELLCDRIKFLTSNYPVFDIDSNTYRLSGIYYNYRLVDQQNSKSLTELDVFLKRLLLGNKSKHSKLLALKLSKNGIRNLLKYSFKKGFDKKVIYSYKKNKMVNIGRCWAYGK